MAILMSFLDENEAMVIYFLPGAYFYFDSLCCFRFILFLLVIPCNDYFFLFFFVFVQFDREILDILKAILSTYILVLVFMDFNEFFRDILTAVFSIFLLLFFCLFSCSFVKIFRMILKTIFFSYIKFFRFILKAIVSLCSFYSSGF